MVRFHVCNKRLTVGSPHPRGDGPRCPGRCDARVGFSPPAWGWSATFALVDKPNAVLPTRVGMVRIGLYPSRTLASSPHPRGDGPITGVQVWGYGWFSPPAWGWSVRILRAHRIAPVLPTRVGMVRPTGAGAARSPGSPHPRGDGPRRGQRLLKPTWFSPPAWGWSGLSGVRISVSKVLPTRVGMVRRSR